MSYEIASILPLKGVIQHYDWGGYTFIPELIGASNREQQPFAELWMGTHPRGTATVRIDSSSLPLDQLIARRPEAMLGPAVAERFQKQLPFLFKVLDVRKMLSIQAHPTRQQAEKGFQRENELGIPIDASHRVFRDPNHKPEVMVALTTFWLLHGFRSPAEIQKILEATPEFSPLLAHFRKENLAILYRHVMELDQKEVNRLLNPLLHRLQKEAPFKKSTPHYWALQAFEDYTSEQGDLDRGIFSIYFFNLVRLSAGEGIFQDAGIPHAYLEGANVELMANSDNVFRGGLTAKHIDVPALMEHLVFDPVTPAILSGRQISATERIYPTPVPDFELSRIVVAPGVSHHQTPVASPHVLIVMEGNVQVDGQKTFSKGESFFIGANQSYQISSEKESLLFQAGVPV